jgi:hypothetical protein
MSPFDIPHLQKKSGDRNGRGITCAGYEVHSPQGTFYYPAAQITLGHDDRAFKTDLLAQHDIFVLSRGKWLNFPVTSRISLTAQRRDDRALPSQASSPAMSTRPYLAAGNKGILYDHVRRERPI